MYTNYFGFREKPFNITPDPRFFYDNPVYKEAYASLLYGIRERKGFIVLTGEVGTGKTTLLQRLMHNLEATVRFVFFYNTTLTFEELVSFACEELGLPVKGLGRLQKIQALNEFLIDQLKKGGTGVLLIDEAQNLGEEVLENLRLLSNLETASEKLLQIVLVGQPELEAKLDQPRLRQLKQRVALWCRLDRLKNREVGPYINHRLRAAGYEGDEIYSRDAVEQVAYYSKCIPRLINIICDNALLVAYASSVKKVSADIIKEVANDLRLAPEAPPASVPIPAAKALEVAALKTEAVVEAGNGEEEKPAATPQADEPVELGPRWKPVIWAGLASILLIFSFGVWELGYTNRTTEFLSNVTLKGKDVLGTIEEGVASLKQVAEKSIAGLLPGNSAKVPSPASSEPVMEPQFGTALPASEGAVALAKQVEPAPLPTQINGAQRNQGSLAAPVAQSPSDAKLNVTKSSKSEPIVIQYGSTISEVVSKHYGGSSNLALDLTKEFNSHIENLNWVLAGQKLRLPPLTRETLLRKQSDGSYHLILASFSKPEASEEFARIVRRKGYQVVITARNVSNGLSLSRVEIGGLDNLEAANQAWDMAMANHWISLPSGISERRSYE